MNFKGPLLFAGQPNILHILADDMGRNALSCYDSKTCQRRTWIDCAALHTGLCRCAVLADTRATFQAAIDAAHMAGGGCVFVLPGMYRLNGMLTVKLSVTLEGIFTALPTIPWTAESLRKGPPNGLVLLTFAGKGDASGTPFIQPADTATVKGLLSFLGLFSGCFCAKWPFFRPPKTDQQKAL